MWWKAYWRWMHLLQRGLLWSELSSMSLLQSRNMWCMTNHIYIIYRMECLVLVNAFVLLISVVILIVQNVFMAIMERIAPPCVLWKEEWFVWIFSMKSLILWVGSNNGQCEGGVYGRGVCICDFDHSDYGMLCY